MRIVKPNIFSYVRCSAFYPLGIILVVAAMLFSEALLAGEGTKISIDTSPAAEIFLDGNRIGKSPVKGRQVSPGRHWLQYKNTGMGEQFEFSINVTEGKHLFCTYDFRQARNVCGTSKTKPADVGKVDLRSEPSADVFLNGRLIGKTPVEKLSLDSGTHSLEFRHPRYESVKKEINLQAGEHVQVDVKFQTETASTDEAKPSASE